MTNYVEYTSGGKYSIPHRAYPTNNADGSVTWQIEYRQNPKEAYWGPRGVFTERDGKFYFADQEFSSAYRALAHRVEFG